MAAILGRPGRKRRSSGPTHVNRYVTDRGRRYRLCFTSYGRILMVMLRSEKPGGFERVFDTSGRRARQLLRLDAEQNKSLASAPSLSQ
jgi:hypothetical protein